jgi:hypothetical protein
MTTSDMNASISRARVDLAKAKGDLDAAEQALPQPDADTTMASPSLMAVLQRVRAAQRHLSDLETLLATEALSAARGREP